MPDISQHSNPGNRLTSAQVSVIVFTIISITVTLLFVFNGLNFYFGVDYRMFCNWQATYLNTGSFYPPDTVFFNFPLTVIAFGPWAFFQPETAVTLKFVQTLTLSVLSMWLLQQISGVSILKNRTILFVTVMMVVPFITTQLCYLNIYVEVLACLLLSLYFQKQGKEVFCGLFLSIAVIFKIFLMPIVIAPLLARRYKSFFWAVSGLVILCFISLLIFGLQIHTDMISAMVNTYSKMRLHGLRFPFVSDGFAGYQDLFNKLALAGVFKMDSVLSFTLTTAIIYGSISCYTLFLILRSSQRCLHDSVNYVTIFATVLILSVGFNFRFDHGALLIAAIPLITCINGTPGRVAVCAVVIMTLTRYTFVQLFQLFGIDGFGTFFSMVFYFLSFQFIGINLLLLAVVLHWVGEYRNHYDYGY